jgi:hypothetical protein
VGLLWVIRFFLINKLITGRLCELKPKIPETFFDVMTHLAIPLDTGNTNVWSNFKT